MLGVSLTGRDATPYMVKNRAMTRQCANVDDLTVLMFSMRRSELAELALRQDLRVTTGRTDSVTYEFLQPVSLLGRNPTLATATLEARVHGLDPGLQNLKRDVVSVLESSRRRVNDSHAEFMSELLDMKRRLSRTSREEPEDEPIVPISAYTVD